MQGSGDCSPGKEEDLSASLPGAMDVALALHQLLHALQVQACMHRTSPAASNILMKIAQREADEAKSCGQDTQESCHALRSCTDMTHVWNDVMLLALMCCDTLLSTWSNFSIVHVANPRHAMHTALQQFLEWQWRRPQQHSVEALKIAALHA